jgi:predicted dehydrogenase
MSVACLEAGLHVLVEKPMCTSMAEADQMIRAAKKSGRKLYVGYNKRLAPSHRKAKELIEEGRLGKVVYVTSVMKDWRPTSYYEQAQWHAKQEMQGGGVLMNPASHALEALLWWFGEAELAIGFCENLHHQVEVEDTASAFIKFRSGVTANLLATTALPLSMSRTEFDGTEASLSLDSWGLRIMGRNEDAWQTVDLPEMGRDTTDLQLDLFVDCIEKDTEPAVPPEQGRRAVELALAIYRSSRLGRTVRLPL